METLQINKQDLIDWIKDLDDSKTLLLLQNIKYSQSEGDWWDEIPGAVKEGIKEGLEDIKAGRTVPHEQVRKTYEKWL